jgi:hypothetical protein
VYQCVELISGFKDIYFTRYYAEILIDFLYQQKMCKKNEIFLLYWSFFTTHKIIYKKITNRQISVPPRSPRITLYAPPAQDLFHPFSNQFDRHRLRLLHRVVTV